MTLQDWMVSAGVRVNEVRNIRLRVSLPKYALHWSNHNWYDRNSGRVQVTDLEARELNRILCDIRKDHAV